MSELRGLWRHAFSVVFALAFICTRYVHRVRDKMPQRLCVFTVRCRVFLFLHTARFTKHIQVMAAAKWNAMGLHSCTHIHTHLMWEYCSHHNYQDNIQKHTRRVHCIADQDELTAANAKRMCLRYNCAITSATTQRRRSTADSTLSEKKYSEPLPNKNTDHTHMNNILYTLQYSYVVQYYQCSLCHYRRATRLLQNSHMSTYIYKNCMRACVTST